MAELRPTTAFRRVRELFEAAVELPPDARQAFLDRACDGTREPALRREVEQLLACDAAEDEHAGELADLVDRGAGVPAGLAAGAVSQRPHELGGRIDAFRLLAVLGSGGMGTVYEAEQDEPRRRVALKVLSLGLASEQAVRRFRWEAEVLAKLQHPAIAQVFAVGVHKSGEIELPWFAMELVAGAGDLISHAQRRQLSVRQRVRLLLQICDAVHHGHLQGVVHRDLKPQNLLVDEAGRVKVIDFGIARSMAGEGCGMTEGGVVLGTLQYMSPEQLRGGAVDLRSDIYALGVVAFELLSGRRPFVFDETTPLKVAEVVSQQDAPRLSTVVKGIDRDLEVVVQKALRREPAERYASAAEFADDLRAFLDARPVRARAPSTFYQVRMFARRRRGLVTALCAIAVLVVVALVVVLAQNRELERQRQALVQQNTELERRQRVVGRVARFAKDFLSESSLMRTRGVDYTVREALDAAAAGIDGEDFEDAEIEAELRELIGSTYKDLSLPAVAEPHLVRAHELWQQVGGAGSPRAIDAAVPLALAMCDQGRVDEAAIVLDRCAAAMVDTGGGPPVDDPLWWRVQHNRAHVMRHLGRYRDAEGLFREVVAARERLLGGDAYETVVSMHTLGTLLLGLQDAEAARDVLADALARSRRAGHPAASTWQIADNLAEAWRDLGNLDEAAGKHREAMQGFAELVGPDHLLTLGCGYHLLKVLYRKGDFDQLEQLASDLLARCERTLGATDYRTMDVLQALAAARMQTGDVDGALGAQQRAFAGVGADRGAMHPATFNAGHNLVMAQLGAGRTDDALATTSMLLTRIADEPEATVQLPPNVVGTSWLLRARALVQAERRDEALTAARTARERLAADLSAEHELTRAAAELEQMLQSR